MKIIEKMSNFTTLSSHSLSLIRKWTIDYSLFTNFESG